MFKRERRFYSEEFKERVLTSYQNSNDSVSMIAFRFQVKCDTHSSWVYRKRTWSDSRKSVKFASSEPTFMKTQALPTEQMGARIRELKRALSTEKMRMLRQDD